MHDSRLEKLAAVLVDYSVNVQKGQLIRISGSTVAAPLLIEVYRKVVAAGAHPVVRIGAAEMGEIFLKTASDEQLIYISPLAIRETEIIDATIDIGAAENTKAMTNIDPARAGVSARARKPVQEIFNRRSAEGNLKWVYTQYPCNASAQDAEMSLAEYDDFVFSAGLLHEADPVGAWKKLSERQARLRDYLAGKDELHVTAANGTDIRLSTRGMTWLSSDGRKNFPDGEVYTGPVMDSVNGVVRFSFPAVDMGREVSDVKLVFKEGKVVDASAGKGQDFLYSVLDMDAGARFLGECAIGTNYSITRYTKNTLFDEKIGGTVHFALGNGYPETGNCNQSGLHWDMVVDLRGGGAIEVDGVRISEDGRFLTAGWPG